MAADAELFPIFLKLAGRQVLVVGGGVVATSKVAALLPTQARITVVAPSVSDAIRDTGVTIHERPFEDADLEEQWLVVSAATPDVNRQVADAAARRHLFVNAVDDPANASAYLGGVLRRDALTMAISTSGRAPALAGLIRQALDALLPQDLAMWFERADALKREWRSTGVPMEERRPQLLDALIRLSDEARGSAARGPETRGSAAQGKDGHGRVPAGFVSLVGAGPGDPDLLTSRAMRRLRGADVVFYDGLVTDAVLALAPSAEHVSVARRSGPKPMTQADVNERLIAAARAGKRVVRLKAGDPFVLGRGGEEMLALVDAGISYEVVPGVSSATAAPALAGIPVTHRGLASGFVVVSGHGADAYGTLIDSLPPGSATIVVLMGIAERAGIRRRLLEAGWDAATPAAIVSNASQPDQAVWIGTLDALESPDFVVVGDDAGVMVIGQVVTLARAADLVRVEA